MVGILSQLLLPTPDGSLLAVTEYFQNEAATRRWIADEQIAELKDHLVRSEGPTCRSFLSELVAAARAGRFDPTSPAPPRRGRRILIVPCGAFPDPFPVP